MILCMWQDGIIGFAGFFYACLERHVHISLSSHGGPGI